MNIYLVVALVNDVEIYRNEIYALSPQHAEMLADNEIYESDPYNNPYLADSGIEYRIRFLGKEK